MKVKFQCPKCQQTYTAKPTAVGKTVRCQKCGESFQIEADGKQPSPPAEAQPSSADISLEKHDQVPSNAPRTLATEALLKDRDRDVEVDRSIHEYDTPWDAGQARRNRLAFWGVATIFLVQVMAAVATGTIQAMSQLSDRPDAPLGDSKLIVLILGGVMFVAILVGIALLMFISFKFSRGIHGTVVNGLDDYVMSWRWTLWSNSRAASLWNSAKFRRVVIFSEQLRRSDREEDWHDAHYWQKSGKPLQDFFRVYPVELESAGKSVRLYYFDALPDAINFATEVAAGLGIPICDLSGEADRAEFLVRSTGADACVLTRHWSLEGKTRIVEWSGVALRRGDDIYPLGTFPDKETATKFAGRVCAQAGTTLGEFPNERRSLYGPDEKCNVSRNELPPDEQMRIRSDVPLASLTPAAERVAYRDIEKPSAIVELLQSPLRYGAWLSAGLAILFVGLRVSQYGSFGERWALDNAWLNSVLTSGIVIALIPPLLFWGTAWGIRQWRSPSQSDTTVDGSAGDWTPQRQRAVSIAILSVVALLIVPVLLYTLWGLTKLDELPRVWAEVTEVTIATNRRPSTTTWRCWLDESKTTVFTMKRAGFKVGQREVMLLNQKSPPDSRTQAEWRFGAVALSIGALVYMVFFAWQLFRLKRRKYAIQCVLSLIVFALACYVYAQSGGEPASALPG